MKHIVPIAFTFSKENQIIEKIFTAFVLSVKNQWFLITAGHILKAINESKQNGFRIEKSALIDCLGQNTPHKVPIPFVYKNIVPVFLNQFQDDLDIGFIPLSNYYRNLLIKNNIEALDENAWKNPPREIDECWLVGLPSELMQISEANYSVMPVALTVIPQTEKPFGFENFTTPHFYGRIQIDDVFDSIEGMSGGPIFVFKESKGKLRYWVLAVQSSWLDRSQYINAIPIQFVGDLLTGVLGELTSTQKT